VDCKGAGLGGVARQLAARHGVPFHRIDPDTLDAPESRGYDPCTGDASAITNKLVGAFSYQGAAEIYKHAAMHVLPVLVRALREVGERVTLDALSEALDRDGMAELGRRAGDSYRTLLSGLARQGGVAVEQFAVHPNELRTLPPGQAAVRSVARRGKVSTVHVHPGPIS